MRHSLFLGTIAAFAIMMAGVAKAEETSDDNEWAAIKAADKTVVEAAMSRSEAGASKRELDRLPLPGFVHFHTLERALSFPSAWSTPSVSLHREPERNSKLQWTAFYGAWLYYYEWACETGAERKVAEWFGALLPQVVTTYPERLLIKFFIQERGRLGYDLERRCEPAELSRLRGKYQELRNEWERLASSRSGADG